MAMGSTAARSLLGHTVRLEEQRGTLQRFDEAESTSDREENEREQLNQWWRGLSGCHRTPTASSLRRLLSAGRLILYQPSRARLSGNDIALCIPARFLQTQCGESFSGLRSTLPRLLFVWSRFDSHTDIAGDCQIKPMFPSIPC